MRRLIWDLIKLGIVILFAVWIFMLMGCASRVPKTLAECEIHPYKQLWEEKEETVEDCKMAVLKAEDRKARRREELAAKEACRVPRVWDVQWKECRDPSPLVWPRQH